VGSILLAEDDCPFLSFTVSGTPEKPYAPTDLAAEIDGSDIDISWNRRSRKRPVYVGGIWTVPLGEASEAYRVDILSGSLVVLRTLSITTNSVTYTDAQITADFGSMPPVLRFRVYQVSARVGRGFAAFAEITL
jgi:hypothetical protein